MQGLSPQGPLTGSDQHVHKDYSPNVPLPRGGAKTHSSLPVHLELHLSQGALVCSGLTMWGL